MDNAIDLEFCFKGSRQYVHGTDIFTKLLEEYSDAHKIDLSFHGITINNMTFSTERPINKDIKVTYRCLSNNIKVKLFGFENNKNVECRYEYLEEVIVNNCIVDISKENILLNTQTKYSFIEHIVAMNKALLEDLYSEIDGKWYFTRLQLDKNILMSEVSSLRLELKSNFQFKLTKSVILVNNNEVGFIYFSLIPKES